MNTPKKSLSAFVSLNSSNFFDTTYGIDLTETISVQQAIPIKRMLSHFYTIVFVYN